MSRPFPSRSSFPSNQGARINGKIRAREVRVVGDDGHQHGVLSLADAINMARALGVDLVEVAPNAVPPVCRLVDYGKYKYEQNKRESETKKHQHANRVKEIQISPQIDKHDFGVKLGHAIDFLCEEMKVKVVLKFRGREMAHKEFGFQQIEKFTNEIAPYGHPDNVAKLVGRGVTVMFSPLPRNKRAKNPRGAAAGAASVARSIANDNRAAKAHMAPEASPATVTTAPGVTPMPPQASFSDSPFAKLDLAEQEDEPEDRASEA